MTTPTAIMIFAAGRGTRMQPLTHTRPKPLINVAGKALIDHAMALVNSVDLPIKVVNLHAFPDMVTTHLSGQDITFSDETNMLLETGGGLRHALPLLGPDPVFTLNTDAVWRGPNPLRELQAAWDPGKMDALLHLVPQENAIGHLGQGDFLVAADGKLSRGPGPIYTGTQIIKTDRLAEITEDAFSLNQLWDMMDAQGRLFGLISDVQWCDVGQPNSIPLAEALLDSAHAN